jgi:tetratricopeptide (TPR) repeat protein
MSQERALNLSKAEALKRAKEENKLDKMTNSVMHFIEGRAKESITLSQETLPELPTLHFKSCQNCTFIIPDKTKVVKILFESCDDCSLELKGCVLSSIIEIWRSDRCTVFVDCAIGTLQVDVCNDLTINFAKGSHMGMIVQAGVHRLKIQSSDGTWKDYDTGLEELRAGQAGPDAESINDSTDQCITRLVDGRLLTERILRLANDYPTTAREKAAFDAEARRKAAAMEGMVKDMLQLGKPSDGNASGISGVEAERLRLLAEQATTPDADCSDSARARYRRDQGNEAFKLGDFQQAAVFYTEGLVVDDKDPALYANRAACFLKLGQADRALSDSDRCIALDPASIKGHFRRGVALMALDRPEEAAAAMARTLDLDPRNADARATLQLAQAKIARLRAA